MLHASLHFPGPLLAALVLAGALPAQELLLGSQGEKGDQFGWSAAGVGDIDRDGTVDWAIGAPQGFADDGGAPGYVRILSGVDGRQLHQFQGGAAASDFGYAVAGPGDVNRDGFTDVLVGARYDRGSELTSGAAYLFSGADGRLLLRLEGSVTRSEFGRSVAGIGDANGDGRGDLLVGAPREDANGRGSGAVYLYSGHEGQLLHRLTGESPQDAFGTALCALGDRTGDGHTDFAVGAPQAGDRGEGRVYLVDGLSGEVFRTIDGVEEGGRFGAALATAGDVDGDGSEDWMAGAPSTAEPGVVRVFSGNTGEVLREFRGDWEGGQFGSALAAVGDLDGDLRTDLAVGAPRDGGNGVDTGMVRVFSGRDGAVLGTYYGFDGERFGFAIAGPLQPNRHAGFFATAPAASGNGRASGLARMFRPAPNVSVQEEVALGGAAGLAPSVAGEEPYAEVGAVSYDGDTYNTYYQYYYDDYDPYYSGSYWNTTYVGYSLPWSCWYYPGWYYRYWGPRWSFSTYWGWGRYWSFCPVLSYWDCGYWGGLGWYGWYGSCWRYGYYSGYWCPWYYDDPWYSSGGNGNGSGGGNTPPPSGPRKISPTGISNSGLNSGGGLGSGGGLAGNATPIGAGSVVATDGRTLSGAGAGSGASGLNGGALGSGGAGGGLAATPTRRPSAVTRRGGLVSTGAGGTRPGGGAGGGLGAGGLGNGSGGGSQTGGAVLHVPSRGAVTRTTPRGGLVGSSGLSDSGPSVGIQKGLPGSPTSTVRLNPVRAYVPPARPLVPGEGTLAEPYRSPNARSNVAQGSRGSASSGRPAVQGRPSGSSGSSASGRVSGNSNRSSSGRPSVQGRPSSSGSSRSATPSRPSSSSRPSVSPRSTPSRSSSPSARPSGGSSRPSPSARPSSGGSRGGSGASSRGGGSSRSSGASRGGGGSSRSSGASRGGGGGSRSSGASRGGGGSSRSSGASRGGGGSRGGGRSGRGRG